QRGGDGRRNGLLMYAPIYANGILPSNVQARRTAMSGWIYAPFHVRTFVESALHQLDAAQELRIVDVGKGGAGSEVYVSPGFREEPGGDALAHSDTIEPCGRTWRGDFQSPRAEGGAGPASELRANVGAGLIVSFLLFAVVLTL